MPKNWWFKFEYRVWQSDPELSVCSLGARGFWLEIISAMHSQDVHMITGSYEKLARLARCESSEVAKYVVELKEANAANVTLGNGTVTLVSRRLKRAVTDRKKTRLRVAKHRCNDDVTPDVTDRVRSKSKSKSKSKKEKKKNVAAATDSEWLDALSINPAYSLLDVRQEFSKAQVWAETNSRQCTRRFFVNWLNRAKPIDPKANGKAQVGKHDDTAPLPPTDHRCRLGHDYCLDLHRDGEMGKA
jgi:hypothetical protein